MELPDRAEYPDYYLMIKNPIAFDIMRVRSLFPKVSTISAYLERTIAYQTLCLFVFLEPTEVRSIRQGAHRSIHQGSEDVDCQRKGVQSERIPYP